MGIDGPVDSHRMESVHSGYTPSCEGLKTSQRDSTEIVIEIKQLYPGRMASIPFIASNRRYMVFPLSYNFTIENGLLD